MISTIRNCAIYRFKLRIRRYSSIPSLENANLDWEYYFNDRNHNEIMENIERRTLKKPSVELFDALKKLSEAEKSQISCGSKIFDKNLESIRNRILWLPNKTHPGVIQNPTEEPKVLEKCGTITRFSYHPASFDSLVKRLNIARTQFLGHISGSRAYFFKSDLAELERALVQFTLQKLLKRGFLLVSVPDVVSTATLECCGMKTEGQHSQVFHLDEQFGSNLCLSGTAEMPLAALYANKVFDHTELPCRLCAVSRCYRAEAKRSQTEKGIYRVHYFTKVEMFGITAAESGTESENLMKEFMEIQKDLFSELGLHFQIVEMPPNELGLPAYQKVDMEAWMPGRKMYGEISSTSNCTDYQSRRLNIKYSVLPADIKFCHTVNGTACAVPRMLIAIVENFQNLNGSVNVPEPLQKYMKKTCINEKFLEFMRSMKPV